MTNKINIAGVAVFLCAPGKWFEGTALAEAISSSARRGTVLFLSSPPSEGRERAVRLLKTMGYWIIVRNEFVLDNGVLVRSDGRSDVHLCRPGEFVGHPPSAVVANGPDGVLGAVNALHGPVYREMAADGALLGHGHHGACVTPEETFSSPWGRLLARAMKALGNMPASLAVVKAAEGVFFQSFVDAALSGNIEGLEESVFKVRRQGADETIGAQRRWITDAREQFRIVRQRADAAYGIDWGIFRDVDTARRNLPNGREEAEALDLLYNLQNPPRMDPLQSEFAGSLEVFGDLISREKAAEIADLHAEAVRDAEATAEYLLRTLRDLGLDGKAPHVPAFS